MARETIRVGFAGAGYIAGWHAAALQAVPGVRLAAVADPARSAAASLAATHGAAAFASVEDMLAAGACDAVHVLTPPGLHAPVALACLAAGTHVLVEKPFALTEADCRAMAAAADAAGRVIAVNHNFLGLPAYARLKRLLADGLLGRIDAADIRWRFPLSPLRSGPFGGWMLAAPENLLYELGPHAYAFAVDLLGPLEDLALRVSKPVTIPGGVTHFQSWRVLGRAGSADVSIALSLVEGADDRSLTLHGVGGTARLDFAADTLVVDRPNAADIVMNPLLQEAGRAGQHLREGAVNALRQLGSLNRRSPYALGFQGTFAAFYQAVRDGGPVDPRFSGMAAAEVIGAIGRSLALLPAAAPSPVPAAAAAPAPNVAVVGGTGFIGRALTRALVASGRSVRVLSRGRGNPFADLGNRVEIVPVSLKDPEALRAAFAGLHAVYHLARAEEASWQGYLENDVAVAEAIGEAALAVGLPLLVYTGTIAAYDASRPDREITEETGFGDDMTRRNLYARSKALCEERLIALERSRGLRLVIARPGVVVGPGGPLQHWGIGRWHGPGAVRLWGDGRNPVPFVLVDDVADALVRILDVEAAVGRSFNLVGDPLLSARDWFDAIAERTGTRIRLANGALAGFWLADTGKYLLKRHVLGQRELAAPSLVDWRSRAHLSRFDNARAKAVLGWRPAATRADFVARAIDGGALFGF